MVSTAFSTHKFWSEQHHCKTFCDNNESKKINILMIFCYLYTIDEIEIPSDKLLKRRSATVFYKYLRLHFVFRFHAYCQTYKL